MQNGPPSLQSEVKIILPGHMMAPVKRFGELSITEKNPDSFKGTVLEKLRKTAWNVSFGYLFFSCFFTFVAW